MSVYNIKKSYFGHPEDDKNIVIENLNDECGKIVEWDILTENVSTE